MKLFSVFFICALALLPVTGFAEPMPKEHFIIQYVEPGPEAAATPEEIQAWMNTSEEFADTEKEMRRAYEETLKDFGTGGQSWLEMNQADWAKRRLLDAFEQHAPKGGPAYLEFMSREAEKRADWLEKLAEKGKVVFTHNYLYRQPGYEGMIILYYRDRGMEYELYTRNLDSGAICEGSGEAPSSGGKAQYENITIEFVNLGKGLKATSSSETSLCEEGGRFAGNYELTK